MKGLLIRIMVIVIAMLLYTLLMGLGLLIWSAFIDSIAVYGA